MFRLKRRYARRIIAHAREEAPNECCGVLAGKNGEVLKVYRAANAEHSPYRYSIDPRDLYRIYTEVETNGWEFLAIYHSHPSSEAYPSDTDVSLSRWPAPAGAIDLWPNVYHLIVSLAEPRSPLIRAFRIEGGGVVDELLEVVD